VLFIKHWTMALSDGSILRSVGYKTRIIRTYSCFDLAARAKFWLAPTISSSCFARSTDG
jgi:hypothetical protein